MFDAVLFDMDGLMFDTETIWRASWGPTLIALNLPLDARVPEAVRGTTAGEFAAAVRRVLGPDVDIDQIWDVWQTIANTVFKHGVAKKPGLDEIVDFLKERDVPIAVASSSTVDQIRLNLENTGLLDRFDAMVSGLEVAHAKPEPDVFLRAAEILGADPARTLVLEDSYNGVRAGHAGGFITIMVPDLSEPTDEMRELADRICPSLLEVRDLLAAGEIG